MKRKEGLLLLAVLLVLGMTAAGCSQKKEASAPVEKPVTASKGVDMQEGKWKITNTIEMQGMPAGMMKPQTITTTTCLSQQDYVPKDTAQKDCTMKDLTVDGNTVNWEILLQKLQRQGQNHLCWQHIRRSNGDDDERRWQRDECKDDYEGKISRPLHAVGLSIIREREPAKALFKKKSSTRSLQVLRPGEEFL